MAFVKDKELQKVINFMVNNLIGWIVNVEAHVFGVHQFFHVRSIQSVSFYFMDMEQT